MGRLLYGIRFHLYYNNAIKCQQKAVSFQNRDSKVCQNLFYSMQNPHFLTSSLVLALVLPIIDRRVNDVLVAFD